MWTSKRSSRSTSTRSTDISRDASGLISRAISRRRRSLERSQVGSSSIRGVAADSAVAGLVERGLIAEAGRDEGHGGAVRYKTTALFERVFELESLSQLPRLDDVGEDADAIRERLAAIAEKRTA